jgi:hypothetical protein
MYLCLLIWICGFQHASGIPQLPASYYVERSKITSKLLEQFDCSLSAALQFTNQPSNNNVVVLSRTYKQDFGFGSQIHNYWAPTVINAFLAGRRVVLGETFKEPWNYGCPGYPGAGDVLEMARFDEKYSSRKDLGQDTLPLLFSGNRFDRSKAHLTCHGKTINEDQLLSAGFSFWMRYTPGITAMINERKRSLRPTLSERFHGVHYRGGDKLAFESKNQGPGDTEDAWVANILRVFYQDDPGKNKTPLYLDSDTCHVVESLTAKLRKQGVARVASLWKFPCTQKLSPYIQNGMKAPVAVIGHNQNDFNRARSCNDTVNFFATLELYQEAADVYLAKGSNVGLTVRYLRMAGGKPDSTLHVHNSRVQKIPLPPVPH